MISAYAHGPRAGGEYISKLLGDAAIGVFNGERVDGEVAKIGDAPLFEWIDLEHWVPRPDHGRLHADVARSEAWPRAVGGPAIKWDSDECEVQFFRARDVRKPHECGHARKARIDQRVHRLRMRLRALFGFHKVSANYKAWR